MLNTLESELVYILDLFKEENSKMVLEEEPNDEAERKRMFSGRIGEINFVIDFDLSVRDEVHLYTRKRGRPGKSQKLTELINETLRCRPDLEEETNLRGAMRIVVRTKSKAFSLALAKAPLDL